MKNIKFRIDSPKHSVAIQERLFRIGYDGFSSSTGEPAHIDKDYLYAHKNGFFTYGFTEEYFDLLSNHIECDLDFIMERAIVTLVVVGQPTQHYWVLNTLADQELEKPSMGWGLLKGIFKRNKR